jgi:glycosyltransferase involved in cell wall biosynthesis
MSTLPKLSVILPTFNESSWLSDTLRCLDAALQRANWVNTEIIVVNDGSSDPTVEVVESLALNFELRCLSQPNSGRFAARKMGLEAATGTHVLLIDSRVHVQQDSLSFLANQIQNHPERQVWNGDVNLADPSNPYSAFWTCITRAAWRQYFKTRTLNSFGDEEFDYFPKGTTFFFAPRELLLDSCNSFESNFDDASLANDDTVLIRPIARRTRIYISPDFICTYFSRDSRKKFWKHSYHRGTVFVDAYFRAGSRYLPIFIGLVAFSIALLLLLAKSPVIGLSIVVIGILVPGFAFKFCGLSMVEILGFYRALPVFVPSYTAGISRGLLFLWSKKLFKK